MKKLFALALYGLLLCPAMAQDIDYDRLRKENILAVNMTDEQIGFYMDETQWPSGIPAAKRLEYSQETLNLRIVHINTYLEKTSVLPRGGDAQAWYRSPLVDTRIRTFSPARGYGFTQGSMYNPIYVNTVSPSQPGGNWSMGISYNHTRF